MKRAILPLLVVALVIVMAHDMAVTPRQSFSARATLAAIDSYRAHVSPHLRGVIYCRFKPTCSEYGREAVRKYGFAVGSYRAVKRVLRCGPWTPAGTVDRP